MQRIRALGFLAFSVFIFTLSGRGAESLLVVVNEFGQGVAGSGEWVELLVVGTGPCSTVDLRGYRLLDREGYLGLSFPTRVVFRSVAAWAAVPAGTLLVIYKGDEPTGNFPPGFPFNDLDFSDFRVSIPHTNTDFFENVAWGGFGNAGDYVVVLDSAGNLVDGLSYGNRTGEGTAPEVKLGTVGANTAAWFAGGSTAHINNPAYWRTGSESGGASTPGAPNGGENTVWRNFLLPKPAISVIPISHDFGAILVGRESVALSLTVQNTGCAPLVVGQVILTGANPKDFLIQNDGVSLATLAPKDSGRLVILFKPSSAGTRMATLEIPSNDPQRPLVIIPLSGTGLLQGDVNADGKIDLVDVRLTYQAALGLVQLSSEAADRADLNGNGKVDLEDVELLCRMILGGCG